MTLTEQKSRVLSLIEELDPTNAYLTDDEDIQRKINYVIQMFQVELVTTVRGILTSASVDFVEDESYDLKTLTGFYKLRELDLDCRNIDTIIIPNETVTETVYYYKYPTAITDETEDDDYVFELDDDLLEIMPYGVAGELLKTDPSVNYKDYTNKYLELKAQASKNIVPNVSFTEVDLRAI